MEASPQKARGPSVTIINGGTEKVFTSTEWSKGVHRKQKRVDRKGQEEGARRGEDRSRTGRECPVGAGQNRRQERRRSGSTFVKVSRLGSESDHRSMDFHIM